MKMLIGLAAFAGVLVSALALESAFLTCNSTGSVNTCDVEDGFLVKKIAKVKFEYSEIAGTCNDGSDGVSEATYGIALSDRAIWVSDGCSGTFVVSLDDESSYNSFCAGDGKKLYVFAATNNGKSRKEDTTIPCKFHAVRQTCGDYEVRLTPGNIWRYPKYYLNTIWLGLTKTSTGETWEGRTTNKLAVKYFNGQKDTLFNQKSGDLDTSAVLSFSKTDKGTVATAIDGSFSVQFNPWDPDQKQFKLSEWKFECNVGFTPAGHAKQLCGGWKKEEAQESRLANQLTKPSQEIVFQTFMQAGTEQTDEQCIAAQDLFINQCSEEQRQNATRVCSQILTSGPHTKCVTKYACQPIDTFVDCVKFACSDYTDDEACYNVAESIDLCRNFGEGDLTELVDNRKCYKDYLTIISG